ncbi:MAG: small ribosomal subunit Rsm22 family protein [Opitutales bacterium]
MKRADYYPPSLEAYWVREAQKAFPEDFRDEALRKLHDPIQSLSDLFTRDRPHTYKNYGNQETALLGYGIFYYPQTWTRCRFPLIEAAELRGWRAPTSRPVSVLDIGAGMGAASSSLAQLCIQRYGSPGADLTMIDHSSEALGQTHALRTALEQEGMRISVSTRRADMRSREALPTPKEATFDIIVISFALNEAFGEHQEKKAIAWLRKLKPLLNAGGLLMILEPALRPQSESLHRIADRLVSDAVYHAWGPQLHNGPCPAHYDGKYWSHEVREWTPPKSLKEVNKHLWRSVETLKFSYTLLGTQAPNSFEPSPEFFRLVSPMSQMKGHYLATGIATDGNKYTYDIPTRGYNRDELVLLENIERGDVLEVAELKKLSDRYRIPRPEDITYHFQPR